MALDHDHLDMTTQEQVNLLCMLLVARYLAGMGVMLPPWLANYQFVLRGAGVCAPADGKIFAIGGLLAVMKINFFTQDRTTLAVNTLLDTYPEMLFTNLYLCMIMSTETFARTLARTLGVFICLMSVWFCGFRVWVPFCFSRFWFPFAFVRCRAATCENISLKINYVCEAYAGHPADFFAKSMIWQSVCRSKLLRLSREDAKAAIKRLISMRPGKPRVKDSAGAYRKRSLGKK